MASQMKHPEAWAVRAEFSLSCLAYNLRRALNVLGVQALLDALRPTLPGSKPLPA